MVMPAHVPGHPVELHRWRIERLDELLDAIEASLDELRPWMPWARAMPTRVAEAAVVDAAVTKFDAGTDFSYFVVESEANEIVGCVGLHPRGERPESAALAGVAANLAHGVPLVGRHTQSSLGPSPFPAGPGSWRCPRATACTMFAGTADVGDDHRQRGPARRPPGVMVAAWQRANTTTRSRSRGARSI